MPGFVDKWEDAKKEFETQTQKKKKKVGFWKVFTTSHTGLTKSIKACDEYSAECKATGNESITSGPPSRTA